MPDIGGDPVVVMLGHDAPDRHLAELAADGVSCIVAGDGAMDVAPLQQTLNRELGVERLLVEGGGHINGPFPAAGLVDAISLLVAPALDGGKGVTGAFDVGAAGLVGKARLRMISAEPMAQGVVHLRYAVVRETMPRPGRR
jgi:riboflavin biosynthesis pyrimidine reductase